MRVPALFAFFVTFAIGRITNGATESAAAPEAPIEIGAHFTCPSGPFTAELMDDDARGQNLQITDTRTGAVHRSALALPVLSVNWTPDCHTMIAIEHLAGGSQMTLIQFASDAWKRYDIEPPGGRPRTL
jgi:hypothetical protein